MQFSLKLLPHASDSFFLLDPSSHSFDCFCHSCQETNSRHFYRISPVAVAVAAQRRARSCTATVARVAGCALTPPPKHFRVLASTLITLHSTLHLARFQLLEMSLSAQAEEQPLGSRAKQKAFAAG